MPMLDGFHALLLEGVFNLGVDFSCYTSESTKDVAETLRPFLGQRVRVAAHHLPLRLDSTRWGCGSCLWQDGQAGAGPCPAGHATRPSWLYNVSVEGVLEPTDDLDWRVVGFDGTVTNLELRRMMPGHVGRILAATVLSVEQMRDALSASGLAGAVESLGSLQDVLGRLGGR